MTRDEAIEILESVSFFAPSDIDVDTALDMAIEALERKQGKWLEYKCSICGFEPYNPSGLETFNYCSNCGADMRGDEDDGR